MLNRAILISLVATIALLPWYIIRFSLFGIPITLLEVGVLITIFLWCANLAVKASNIGLNVFTAKAILHIKRYWVIIVPVCLFLIAATISVFQSNNFTAALGIYKAYIIEPILILLVICTSIKSQKHWRLIFAALALSVLQVSLMAISQQLISWPNFAPNELIQGRSSATYNTANAVGLFIGPIIMVLLAMVIGYRAARMQDAAWLTLLSGIGLVAILASKSDGALVAILGSILVMGIIITLKRYGLLNYANWIRLVVAGLVIYVGSILLFVFILNNPPQVANPYTRPGFNTFTIRQCTWEGTANLLKQEPVRGSGLAGFSEKYVEHSTCDAEPLVYPHNLILNFWTETGALGLISIILLIGVWLAMCGKLMQQNGEEFWIGLGLSLALIYWIIHGLVDVPYFKNDLALVWWILYGITVVGYVKINKGEI